MDEFGREWINVSWSKAPYELTNADQTHVAGPVAAVMRSIDEFDPLNATTPIGDGRTIDECLFYLGDYHWIPALKKAVLFKARDMFELVDEAALSERVATFCTGRIMWCQEKRRSMVSDPTVDDDDPAYGILNAYERHARRCDSLAYHARLTKAVTQRSVKDPSFVDADPNLIGTPLGVYDLTNFELKAEQADYEREMERGTQYGGFVSNVAWVDTLLRHVTMSTEGEPDDATLRVFHDNVPRWAEFIDEICDGDADKAAFLQRALGYSMLGTNPEKATFVLYGPKRDNGKSTLMSVVKRALGDYAASAPPQLVLDNRYENYTAANSPLANLKGKRLVDMSEPPISATLNAAMVKQLASGTDEVTARHLHAESFSFVPGFTLWLHCNCLPLVNDRTAIDTDHMHVIEFTRSFRGEDKDPGLVRELTTEDGLSTVFYWLLNGLREYKRQGLNPPQCVLDATRSWLEVSGTWLDDFIEERCEVGTGHRAPVNDFKEALEAYRVERDEEQIPMRTVNKFLARKNIVNRNFNNVRCYRGIRLKDEKRSKSSAKRVSEIVRNRNPKCTGGKIGLITVV